jgi:hypothetical protein
MFVLGGELSLPEMLEWSGTPTPGEGAELDPPETHRFGVYSRRVWDGVLAFERLQLR